MVNVAEYARCPPHPSDLDCQHTEDQAEKRNARITRAFLLGKDSFFNQMPQYSHL